MNKQFTSITKDFNELVGHYDEFLALIEQHDLQELPSVYNLYDIEPFFGQMVNEEIPDDGFLAAYDEFDPDEDDLYLYWISLETKRIYQKRLLLSDNVYYDTFYYYDKEHYRSATIYVSNVGRKAVKLMDLYLKDGLPSQLLICEDGKDVQLREYEIEDGQLNGYQATFFSVASGTIRPFNIGVKFNYNEEGDLESILESGIRGTHLLYKSFDDDLEWKDVCDAIEDCLVNELKRQVISQVEIKEDVYCILLEYSMDVPFPPTVAIGMDSERSGDDEPDGWFEMSEMYYYSESGTLDIILDSMEMQELYLYFNRLYNASDSFMQDELEIDIHSMYSNVTKRLMHVDFRNSFTRTADFVVIAIDAEKGFNDEAYEEAVNYKLKNKL